MNVVAFVHRAVQIARGYGLTVTFEPGWETRSNGYAGRYVGVLVHHTATPSSLVNPFPSRQLLRDGRKGLSGPLCNSAGPADGSIHVMAANAANHAGASGGKSMGPLPNTKLFNPTVWGHEIDYAGTVPMLPGQYRAAVLWSLALLHALREHGQISSIDVQRVRGHAETSVTGKWDPGDAPSRTIDMAAFRAAIQTPPPASTEDEDMQLLKGDADATTFVVYWNQPGPIAVRKRIPNAEDPGYKAAIAAGYQVKTVPQAVINGIPDATMPTVELDYSRFVSDVVTRLSAELTATGVSLSTSELAEIAHLTAIAAADEIDRRVRDNDPNTGPRT